jgi:hypothetical protein
MFGMTLDQSIDFRKPIRRHAKQVVGKPSHLGAGRRMLRPKRMPNVIGILLSHIRLEKHLQSQFAGFPPSTHEEIACG